MPIRAVTFDLWSTLIWDTVELEEYWKLRRLINFHRFVKRRSRRRAGQSEIGYGAVKLAMEKLNAKVDEHYERGLDISSEERGKMLFGLLGIEIAEGESENVYVRAGRILSDSGYRSWHPHLNPEAEPTLKDLRQSFPDLKIGLISNAPRSSKTYERMLHSFDIATHFDALVISSEVGYLKPRKEIFEVALSSLSVRPGDVLHVGDNFRADIVGAVSVGMNAALYTGLWHRYAHHAIVGEHIPEGFKTVPPLVLKEISDLRQAVGLVRESRRTGGDGK